MSPLILNVFDFDGTLYRSPAPPVPDPTWWFHAHSLGEPKAPGFDKRWVLSALAHARRSMLDPTAMTVVLTGRRDHLPMRKKLLGILRLSGIQFDSIVLQPVIYPGPTAEYKAQAVEEWLEDHPSINRVVLYDDEPDNHKAVGAITLAMGRQFKGYVAPGVL